MTTNKKVERTTVQQSNIRITVCSDHLEKLDLSKQKWVDEVGYFNTAKFVKFERTLFDGMIFKEVVFDQCDFTHASFINCTILGCEFRDCVLEGTLFALCSLQGTTLSPMPIGLDSDADKYEDKCCKIVSCDLTNTTICRKYGGIKIRNPLISPVLYEPLTYKNHRNNRAPVDSLRRLVDGEYSNKGVAISGAWGHAADTRSGGQVIYDSDYIPYVPQPKKNHAVLTYSDPKVFLP